MPKIIDGVKATGDVEAGVKVVTPAITISGSAVTGQYLKCTDGNGVAAWAAIAEEVGMIYPTAANNVTASTTLGTSHGVVTCSGSGIVLTLPKLSSADYYGRCYVIVNNDTTPANTVSVVADATEPADTIDAAASLTVPANGGKLVLVGGGVTDHKWYTV